MNRAPPTLLQASVCPPEKSGWKCRLPRVSEVEDGDLSTVPGTTTATRGTDTPALFCNVRGPCPRGCQEGARDTEGEQLVVPKLGTC